MAVRVLHLDDDPALLSAAADYLEGEDERLTLETTTAADEAIELVAEQEIECIVCDYEMPGMDGIEVLETVREEWPDLPFILFTGKGSEQVASEAIKKGVTDYLQKAGPEQYEILAHRIDNLVSEYRTTMELEERERELKAERQFTQQALDALDDILYVLDTDGTIRRWNKATVEVTGYDSSELDGLAATELVPQADKQAITSAVETALQEGEATVEADLLTADGDRIPYEFTGARLTDTNGNVTGLVGVGRDLSQRKRRERRFRALVEESNDIISIIDADGKFLYQSPSIKHIMGYEPQETTGDIAWEYIHPNDREAVQTWFEEDITSANAAERFEYRARHADGSWRWIESRGNNQLDNPAVEGYVVNSRDITDERRTEKLLSGLFEKSLHGIGVKEIVTDESGDPIDYVYKRVNDRFEELTGLDADEVVGERATDVIDGIEDTPFIDIFGEVALEGTTAQFEQYSEPLDRYYEVSAFSPRHGECISVFSEITERKEREEELAQYKTYVEETSDTIAVVASDGTVKFHNATARGESEFSPFNAEGETGFDYVHPEDREQIMDLFMSVLEEETGEVTTELRVETADEEWRWIEARGVNKLDDPDIEGIIVTSYDITERKEREADLQRQNQQLDEFARVISHDLRNPLNVAELRTDLATQECESDHLTDVMEALSRMDALIDDLLTLARQGETVGEREQIALTDIVSACWNNVETGDATITTDVQATLAADRSRMAQALENLFRNAIEHGGESVTVTIGVLDDKRGFYVADDGPGIPEAEREDVFDSGYTTSNDGTGFGLAIVSRICAAHGWDITATESESGGARIEITGVESIE